MYQQENSWDGGTLYGEPIEQVASFSESQPVSYLQTRRCQAALSQIYRLMDMAIDNGEPGLTLDPTLLYFGQDVQRLLCHGGRFQFEFTHSGLFHIQLAGDNAYWEDLRQQKTPLATQPKRHRGARGGRQVREREAARQSIAALPSVTRVLSNK